jgi:hypothetical protein
MKRFEEMYVALWCVVMPITGTVILPGVQGTIPAYVLALASVILVYQKIQAGAVPQDVLHYAKTLSYVFLLWLFLLVTSQLGLIVSDRHDFGDVNMMDADDTRILFRTTLFTQSLYLLACVLIALYFRYFFQERWTRYVDWGGYLLAGYGIYEWLYFLIFHQSGDFLVNRSFGDHTASWSQTITFGGVELLRIKSTLGEPTFFAAVVIPYFFWAMDRGKTALSAMLLFAALFSTSTACLLVLPTVLFIKSFWTGKVRWDYLSVLFVVGLFLAGIALLYPDTFRDLFTDKFTGENDSGATRLWSAMGVRDLYGTFTIPNWLFGIGFGYTYLGVYDALLVNTGLVGLTVFLVVFIRPVLFLPTITGYEGIKAGLLGLLLLCYLSLSELYLPPTWMFLGLAYFKLAGYNKPRLGTPFQPAGSRLRFNPSSHPPAQV